MEKPDDAVITTRKKRVVLVPYPYQGHATPMFDLASILHSKGFSVTIAHSKVNFPNPSSQPAEFTFVKLADRSDGLDISGWNHHMLLYRVLNESCVSAHFEELMSQMMLEKEEVACVVYDPLMKFAEVVAKKLEVKTIALWTVPASFVHSCLVLNRLIEQKVFPVKDSQADDEIPGEYPLRISDVWPVPTLEVPQALVDITRSFLDLESAHAMIWNTIEFLDHPLLEKLRNQHWRVPFFSIGPSHKLSSKTTLTSGGRGGQDNAAACLSWLDKQSPKSVIYVSLGTLVVLDEKSLLDLAWGLAKSEQPFLWSLRRSSIETLPLDFTETIKDRGLIVEWADQKRVLAHESIGGFLTHCGWNSIVEGLTEGVPLLCRPCFADQPVNSRYVTSAWKLGIELEKNCGRSEIERSVRALMVGEEGKEIRQRVLETKEKIEECTRVGGLSYESINRLVDFINKSSESNANEITKIP